ncbi:MAG: helix-turn-helix domain-containing protein [Actinomycetota bacterium]|jgi:transcriptional regulator with XRE-family HTH domain|nr:helix-turn-helix domain-containing protein [Actinomycetota bacterium]
MRAHASPVWRLLREARADAGLTQRQLADRAATAQSAVARYEAARALPDLDTLQRLLAACGRHLELRAPPIDEQEQRQLRESLRLSPIQRAERNRRITHLAERAAAARREGRVRPLIQP